MPPDTDRLSGPSERIVPARGVLRTLVSGLQVTDAEAASEAGEVPIASEHIAGTHPVMRQLIQRQNQVAGIRGAIPSTTTGVVPRPGLLTELFDSPVVAPIEASEARQVDAKGRVQIRTTSAAVGLEPGDKVIIGVDSTGVITVAPFRGSLLGGMAEASVLDPRGRLTLPRWVREGAGLESGDALQCVATEDGIDLISAAAPFRIRRARP